MPGAALRQPLGHRRDPAVGVVEHVGDHVGDREDLPPHHLNVIAGISRRLRLRRRRDRRRRCAGVNDLGARGGQPLASRRDRGPIDTWLKQPEAAASGDRSARNGGAEPHCRLDRQAARESRREAAAKCVAGSGGIDGLNIERRNVRDPAALQQVRSGASCLHHRADYAGRGEGCQPVRRVGGADQLCQFFQARDEQADRPGELHHPVGHAGLPRLVGVEGDDGVGRDLAHTRDDPLGVLERHGGDVHNGGLPERRILASPRAAERPALTAQAASGRASAGCRPPRRPPSSAPSARRCRPGRSRRRPPRRARRTRQAGSPLPAGR